MTSGERETPTERVVARVTKMDYSKIHGSEPSGFEAARSKISKRVETTTNCVIDLC